ncbi:MAG: PepSY-like domain-containing protein [Prevotella sp.]|nr:PepSY-like domain-containing protein [Prevotella sp.]MCM1075137.1 PepSY-like domain-containing protein [Ruminococcus sp.]
MKKTLLTLGLIAMAAMPVIAQKQARGGNRQIPEQLRMERGIGPVQAASVQTSALPENAHAFLKQVFPNATITKVENDFADRQFDVDMSDGYEVTFDYSGNWVEVDAPDGATLPSSTLTALVPEEVVLTTFGSDALLNGGITDVVDEITITPYGYAVEYVTGTVGKGKANVSKSDGSILLKAKKDKNAHMNKGMRHARMDKNARPAQGKKLKKGPRMQQAGTAAQPVVYTPSK